MVDHESHWLVVRTELVVGMEVMVLVVPVYGVELVVDMEVMALAAPVYGMDLLVVNKELVAGKRLMNECWAVVY